jgi:hypothetical protein
MVRVTRKAFAAPQFAAGDDVATVPVAAAVFVAGRQGYLTEEMTATPEWIASKAAPVTPS